MHRISRSLVAALLPLLALAAGCGESASPTAAPDATARAARGGGAPDLSRVAMLRSRPQVTAGWAKAWIGPQGGRVDFAGFAIEVPAGAVERVTMFTIRIPLDREGSDRAIAEFGPHNVAFLKPVFIELPYKNTDVAGSPTQVLWWNEADADWVGMGGTITADGLRVRTGTPHFSTYGTQGDARIGNIVVSGG